MSAVAGGGLALVALIAAVLLGGCQVGIQEPWVQSAQELRQERSRPHGLEHRLRHRAARGYRDR